MTKLRGYQITDQYVTVNYNGQTHMVRRTEKLADQLIQALREGREHEIPDLISVAKRIKKASKGNFVVKDGQIYVNGVVAPKVLGNKIVSFSNSGLPFQPLVRFAENLQKNPSFRAVNELFQFLEKNNHPITENGNFIAYKKVRDDFKDCHSGKFDNRPGTVVKMPRNQVDENCNRTCSTGLHVANYEYASRFYGGGVLLECEVNPADVVSIPVDYNQSKMRVCEYKVLGVVSREHSDDEHLRVTDPEWTEDEDLDSGEYDEDDYTYCEDCGDETDGTEVCDDCDYERDLAYEEEADEDEWDDAEDEDEYPWESEIED